MDLGTDLGAAWVEAARRGDLAAAWQLSDAIRRRSPPRQHPDIPRHVQQIWDGRDLHDRRVLVRCYHGLGDTIQFIRYAPMVAAIAREVIVWAQPALLGLLRTVRGIDRVLPLHDGAPDAAFDVDVEVMELPYVFRTTLDSVPADVPYIRPAEGGYRTGLSGVPAHHASLSGAGRVGAPRVGVVWRGGGWDDRRSIPFAEIAPLFGEPGVTWFDLNGCASPEERHPRLCAVDTCGIDRLASVVAAMDLVISVDTMAAHLAGALGVPVWTLLPEPADWRWLASGDRSPWYPTMRLFRQEHAGGWRGVVSQVQRAMKIAAVNGAG
jgi:hypothetical protein